MDNERGASQDALNYVFSQFSGIFMTSTAFFLFYCGVYLCVCMCACVRVCVHVCV
jgi:hypothetical protein